MTLRIGHGFDIHRLESQPNGALALAGLSIPHDKVLVAHSDGDVIIHAFIDALLGALALGDIGQWFPDTDPKFKDMPSKTMLSEVLKVVYDKGFHLVNLDVTVIAQKPKLKDWILPMREHLAQCCDCQLDQISIKAKTHEKVDAVGQCEAIVAHCVVLLHGH